DIYLTERCVEKADSSEVSPVVGKWRLAISRLLDAGLPNREARLEISRWAFRFPFWLSCGLSGAARIFISRQRRAPVVAGAAGAPAACCFAGVGVDGGA